MPLTIVLISETTLVREAELYDVKKALEKAAQQVADVYKLERPVLEVFSDGMDLPSYCALLSIVDDDHNPSVLAVHGWDPLRGLPRMRGWANRGTGKRGKQSWPEGASHEVNEALVNPRCDNWIEHPTRAGLWIPDEVSDPVQDHYEIDGVLVANFVYPSYFDPKYADADACAAFLAEGGKFDHLGTLKAPGSIGPEGYLVIDEPSKDRRWLEGPNGETSLASLDKPGSMHPWSRTKRNLLEGGPTQEQVLASRAGRQDDAIG